MEEEPTSSSSVKTLHCKNNVSKMTHLVDRWEQRHDALMSHCSGISSCGGASLRWITCWHRVPGCQSQRNLDTSLICHSNLNPIWLIRLFTPQRRDEGQGRRGLPGGMSHRLELPGDDFLLLQPNLTTTKTFITTSYQVSEILQFLHLSCDHF